MFKDPTRYNILVIEDNPGDFALIEDYLLETVELPEITHANSFAAAQKFLEEMESPCEVIFLDLSLPDKKGVDLINAIVKLSPGCPIIVLSGYADFEFSVKSLSLGISDYLIKDDLSPSTLYKSLVYNIERKKILTDLEESKIRYSNLFHLSPQPMWLVDVQTLAFLDVNQAAINHYGYTKEEFLDLEFLTIRTEEEAKKLKAHVNENLAQRKPYAALTTHVKKDGQQIQVEVSSSFIKYKGKDAIVILSNDVTDRQEYIQTIESQNKKLKEISWIQSHVVRAPIARMMGLINLLNTEETSEETKELLQYLQDSAYELDSIVRDISDKTAEFEIDKGSSEK